MTISLRKFGMMLMVAALTTGACQSKPSRTYAALATTDSQTMGVVKSALARAMNRANIEIGPGDLTKTSVISVLPPKPGPNESRSTVRPTQFDIMMQGSACFVVRRDTGDEFPLRGVACRRLAN